MAQSDHLSQLAHDLSRCSQTSQVEQTYLDYAKSMFCGYRVWHTPSVADVVGVELLNRCDYLISEGMLGPKEEVLQDELVCIVGPYGSLNQDLARCLERARELVRTRMSEISGIPDSGRNLRDQSAFRQQIWPPGQLESHHFGILVGPMEPSDTGFRTLLEGFVSGQVPPPVKSWRPYRFGSAKLAFIADAGKGRELPIEEISTGLTSLGFTGRLCAGVANWLWDTEDPASFFNLLQLTLVDARRLARDSSERVTMVLGKDWIRGWDGDGGAGHLAPRIKPKDPLSGGAARRLEG